jgi:hypothetical protein
MIFCILYKNPGRWPNLASSRIGVGFVKQVLLLLRVLIGGGAFVPIGHLLLVAAGAVAAA